MVPAAEDLDLSPWQSPSDGWFASAYDPSDLMRVFDTLWLKAGFTLQAYEFRAGSNGNGIIWAVPSDAPLLAPGECPRLDDRCFRHQLLLPRPYLVLTKPLRLDIQCQRAASVKIGWKYLDD